MQLYLILLRCSVLSSGNALSSRSKLLLSDLISLLILLLQLDIPEEEHDDQKRNGKRKRSNCKRLLCQAVTEINGISGFGAWLIALRRHDGTEDGGAICLVNLWEIRCEPSGQKGVPESTTDTDAC